MEIFSFILAGITATCSALCLALVLSFILGRNSQKETGEDTWVRDGSKPPRDPKEKSISIPVLIAARGHMGIGYWRFRFGYWVCTFSEYDERSVGEVDAWQQFPDYEKI